LDFSKAVVSVGSEPSSVGVRMSMNTGVGFLGAEGLKSLVVVILSVQWGEGFIEDSKEGSFVQDGD
jgi:hypothetical protein